MQHSTFEIIRTTLKSDPTITPSERTRLLDALQQGPDKPANPEPVCPRILRRAEAAKRLGCSLRTVDNLCKEGALKKRSFPGRTRAAGILEADLNAVIAAGFAA